MLRCEKYRRKVDESYGKIGKSYCGEWNYIRSPKWELMKMIGKSMTCIQNR